MKWDVVLSIISSMIIVFVSVVLMLEFYESKNGTLRKLMVALFGCLALNYSVGWIVIAMQYYGFWNQVTFASIRWITAVPLAAVMVWFFYYMLFELKKRK